jgi:hypothetical protein
MTNPYGPPPGVPPRFQPGMAGPPHPPPPHQPGHPYGGPPMGQHMPAAPPSPMGQPMAPPPPGMGRIVLDTSFFPLQFVLYLFKPGITINGQVYPVARWGTNVIDLRPGQYHLQVHTNYLWQYGNAVATIPVNAGQPVNVFYRAPGTPWGPGAIGPVPQPTPNLAVMWLVSFAPAVLVLLLVLVVLLAA